MGGCRRLDNTTLGGYTIRRREVLTGKVILSPMVRQISEFPACRWPRFRVLATRGCRWLTHSSVKTAPSVVLPSLDR